MIDKFKAMQMGLIQLSLGNEYREEIDSYKLTIDYYKQLIQDAKERMQLVKENMAEFIIKHLDIIDDIEIYKQVGCSVFCEGLMFVYTSDLQFDYVNVGA